MIACEIKNKESKLKSKPKPKSEPKTELDSESSLELEERDNVILEIVNVVRKMIKKNKNLTMKDIKRVSKNQKKQST